MLGVRTHQYFQMAKQTTKSQSSAREKSQPETKTLPVAVTDKVKQQNNSGGADGSGLHMDDPDLDDTLLEEEEMMMVENGGAHLKAQEPGPGKFLIPRIAAKGMTLDRMHGSRKIAKDGVEMIAVDVDRVGKLRKMGAAHYLQLIMPLHVELLKLQNWVKEKRMRVVVLFEGRDAAGKGGTIKRFVEHMNPRGCRVVALDKPSDEERAQW